MRIVISKSILEELCSIKPVGHTRFDGKVKDMGDRLVAHVDERRDIMPVLEHLRYILVWDMTEEQGE